MNTTVEDSWGDTLRVYVEEGSLCLESEEVDALSTLVFKGEKAKEVLAAISNAVSELDTNPTQEQIDQYDQEQAEEWFGVTNLIVAPDTTITHSPQTRAKAISEAITHLKKIKMNNPSSGEVLQYAAFILGEEYKQ